MEEPEPAQAVGRAALLDSRGLTPDTGRSWSTRARSPSLKPSWSQGEWPAFYL